MEHFSEYNEATKLGYTGTYDDFIQPLDQIESDLASQMPNLTKTEKPMKVTDQIYDDQVDYVDCYEDMEFEHGEELLIVNDKNEVIFKFKGDEQIKKFFEERKEEHLRHIDECCKRLGKSPACKEN